MLTSLTYSRLSITHNGFHKDFGCRPTVVEAARGSLHYGIWKGGKYVQNMSKCI